MSLDTYANLQTAIASYLHRADLTSAIPDFITLCEAGFNRELRIQTMETRVTATLDEEYEDLPDDYIEMRRLKIIGESGKPLQYRPPEDLTLANPRGEAGSTNWYTIIGNTIQFSRTPSGWTMEMVYYKKIPVLSDSNTTNWMLTNNPDVYLYGALSAAAPYIVDDARLPVWKSLYAQAIQSVRDEDRAKRASGSPLVMRIGTSS